VELLTPSCQLLTSCHRQVVYREDFQEGTRIRNCLFAERRDVVYELFRKMVLDDIR